MLQGRRKSSKCGAANVSLFPRLHPIISMYWYIAKLLIKAIAVMVIKHLESVPESAFCDRYLQ